jgi:hypothetical protein
MMVPGMATRAKFKSAKTRKTTVRRKPPTDREREDRIPMLAAAYRKPRKATKK